MTFHTSLSLITFSASVTRPTLKVHPTSFDAVLVQSFQLSQDFVLSLFSWHVQKRWRLLILFMLNLVVSASCNSFGWFLYSPWDFLILLSPVSFVTFEIVQALYWYIRMGSIEHFRALLFVRIEMWLFVSIDFILWKLSVSYVHHLILKYPSIWIDPCAWVYYLCIFWN